MQPSKIDLNKYNWKEINQDHQDSLTWRQLSLKYKISINSLSNAKREGLFISLNHNQAAQRTKLTYKPKPHSLETRKKISEARKKFLKDNPDKPAWKRNNKFESIPCNKVKEYLKNQNINFVDEFSPLLHLGRHFSIDIAFPDKKIGIEINGAQHYETFGGLKPYYQERHNLIEKEGWRLYEIPYNIAFDLNKIENIIKEIFQSEDKVEFDYLNFQKRITTRVKDLCPSCKINKKMVRSHHCRSCAAKLSKPSKIPKKEILKKLLWEIPTTHIAKKFGVVDNSVAKWCKKYNLEKPPRGYWRKLECKG